MYEMIFSREQVRRQFEKCRRDNLNAIWATETLYVEGNSEEKLKNVLARVGLFDCLECWVAEDALPLGREQKWLNVVLRKV